MVANGTPSESQRQRLDQPSSLKTQRNPSLTTTSGKWRRHRILTLLLLVDVCAFLVPYREILGDMIA
nr:hypothetical protein [Tanacetum cinerariifolium]